MINKLYTYIKILQKSPWDDFNTTNKHNIFTKTRKDQFNWNQFHFNQKIFGLIIVCLSIIWLASGVYRIEEGEQALVMRFNKFHRIGGPGLNFRLPTPIEREIIEKVDQSRRVEIGYRSINQSNMNGSSSSRDIKTESLMLTGDENIIELNVDATWHIRDLKQYIFNIQNPKETVKAAAESAIREVIGNTPITSVLSNRKQFISEKIEHLLQKILDQYHSGVEIEQVKLLRAEPPKYVIAAYRDVQTAKADKEKVINEAEAYMNDILPKARGQAAKILEQAEGYRVEVMSQAKGNTARFNAIYKQYLTNKELTRKRIYLESMESILATSDKIIMDNENILPHMPIKPQRLLNNK